MNESVHRICQIDDSRQRILNFDEYVASPIVTAGRLIILVAVLVGVGLAALPAYNSEASDETGWAIGAPLWFALSTFIWMLRTRAVGIKLDKLLRSAFDWAQPIGARLKTLMKELAVLRERKI
jgi:hypothetical protein